MSKLLGVLALLSSGCATVPRESLDGLRDRFIQEGRDRDVVMRGDAVRLVFVESLPGSTAGRCFPNRRPRLVEISREFWNDSFYADDMRRQVVFHELGHCLLGIRGHTPNLAVNVPSSMFSGESQTYVSIMEREPVPYGYYHGHEAEWLDRLFGRDLRAAYEVKR